MRVSEVYLSIQGEGPRVGSPTVFVRFGGCNLRCPGWPCDTQHAIDPKYRSEWANQSVSKVYSRIREAANGYKDFNVCFTGGEPFLQKANEINELLTSLCLDGDVLYIECFSNGTLPYTKTALSEVCFIMDWKLPGSGEHGVGAVQRADNFSQLRSKDVVKFTIADHTDYLFAKATWKALVEENPQPEYYAGVVWGKLENATLVDWIQQDRLSWKFNMQIHNIIWDRTTRGI